MVSQRPAKPSGVKAVRVRIPVLPPFQIMGGDSRGYVFNKQSKIEITCYEI